ncbi:MAG: MATE family efflux transporter, partial [Bacteroidetes bacterium]|nr:MATE family efflux transporter [Bacteroidota bacterium]
MMGVVDSIMVGELGVSPLAAASVANSMFLFIFIIGIGVSFAITPLVAIAVGAKKYNDCGVIFRQALLVDMVLGVILLVMAYIGADLIQFFDQPKEVVGLATSYGKLLAYSILPAMLFQTYKQFIEGLSIMKPAMVIVLLANIVNAFINWLLIYGNLGLPALGLDGAGWATFTSRMFMAFVLMWYVMQSNRFKQFDVTLHFKSINFKMIKKLLGLGLPSAVQYVFEVGAFFFAVIMVGWWGT